MTKEKDPNNKLPGQPGAKLDLGKAPVFKGVLKYFPLALLEVAKVSAAGSAKYCWGGWETVEDGVTRYTDALLRHMCLDASGEDLDKDTELLHKAHVAWNALAVLELYLRELDALEEVEIVNSGVEPKVNPFDTKLLDKLFSEQKNEKYKQPKYTKFNL